MPSDNLSVENASCILQSESSPFLIDPSSRASEWLKASLKEVEVTTQDDERFVLNLELAVRFGKTLLVQDVNRIDPILFPLLRRDLAGQGPYRTVQIGEKNVDFNENFKLFLSTRNASPELSPSASAIVASVNFTTTRADLTGQLLAAALQHEKPELEQRKSELLKKEEENKIEISKLEDFLLEQLATSSGNILENKELLASLNETKAKSAHIADSLKESSALQENLEAEGNVYLPLAEFASRLFFTIADLVKLNNMYRTSLASFLRLYEATLTEASGGEGNERISALKRTLQRKVYHYIARSLFKSDRLTFGVHLVHGMYSEHFAVNEWDAFVGLLVDDAKDHNDAGVSVPSWVDEDRRAAVGRFRANFPNLFSSAALDEAGIWSAFSKAEECEDEFPVQVAKKISPFEQVLLIQALRPDRLVSSMEKFASSALDLTELSPPALSLKTVYGESRADQPVLIIISSGSDPSEELRELASALSRTLHEVAMGQGQAEVALEKLRLAASNGDWLCLKNLHLMTFWLPLLEKELQGLNAHEKFRVWLTAESHPKFSPILTETCLKVTYESPPGVKRNLQRTLNSWNSETFAAKRSTVQAQAIFALAWFHAIVQERRTYIPQGTYSVYV